MTRAQQEEARKALTERRELVRSRPDDVAALNDLAWTLATDPDSSMRSGAEAVATARRAAQLSKGQEPAILATLAAAYAEAGQFFEAVETARKALRLATQQNNQGLAESIKAEIPFYEAKIPFRALPERVTRP